MKNPNTGKTFLDIDDINSLLPEHLVLDTISVSRSVYQAKDGSLISISNSKVYDKGYLCWYYAYVDRYVDMGVKYMLFTIGLKGLVLVPMDKIQNYKVGCYWKSGKNRGEKRYRFDIKVKQDNSYVFINSSSRFDRELDLTDYFISFSSK